MAARAVVRGDVIERLLKAWFAGPEAGRLYIAMGFYAGETLE